MSSDDGSHEPNVEMLFEGDADAPVRVPITSDAAAFETPEPQPHVVGNDRLGHVVATVNETVELLREQRLEEQMAAGGARTTVFPERIAQVIQATQVDLETVLTLLATGVVTRSLTLDHALASPQDGVAVFDGRLRMPLSRLRRRIELRVYPTASANLTVLELLPKRRWMPQTERYLRAGVPAITDLTDKLEEAAAT